MCVLVTADTNRLTTTGASCDQPTITRTNIPSNGETKKKNANEGMKKMVDGETMMFDTTETHTPSMCSSANSN